MKKTDQLSKLAFKYLSDKCPQIKHPFTPFYFDLLKDRRKTIKKVLEIGIGALELTLKWRPYRNGASLLMWRDFFPNAEVYGADILPSALYNSERIKSFLCDQSSKEDLISLIKNIDSDIDLVIDDGSHKTKDQIFTCKTLLPIINKDVIYIIEDVREPQIVATNLAMYDCTIPNIKGRFRDDNLVIVENKKPDGNRKTIMEQTELCKIAFKYGTDKCPQLKKHAYTPFYYDLLKDKRDSIKKVLEMGIGHYPNMQNAPIFFDRGLKRNYYKGASLKMWRDFFPNAQIYGADVVAESMFTDTRIKTYLCDERKKEDLESLIKKVGSDIDVVIDDASHHTADQIFCAQTLLPLLKKDVTYIIEDVSHSRAIIRALNQVGNYDINVPQIPLAGRGSMLVVIRNKQSCLS